MISSVVKDVFSEGFISVNENDALSQCLPLFKKEMPPVLVVLDNEGRYKGVLARRWVVRSRLNPSTTKVKTLMRSAPRVTLEDSLGKAARLMIESGVRQLPVYGEERLLGFVTDEDIIHGAVMKKWGNSKVEEIMTKRPLAVEEDESIGGVLSLFREHDISHAPVVSDGVIKGIISIHDIIEHTYKPRKRVGLDAGVGEKIKVLSTHVKSLMVKHVITVLPETKLREAVEKMRRFDIASLIVVSKGRTVGIVTKRDFLEPIAQVEEVDRELTVQFSAKDVEIDDVQRDFMMDDFKSFARRYRKTLEAGTLFVYLKAHGSNYKGRQLIHCRLQLRTRKGSFFSSNEGWGVQQTFSLALDHLEKQILRSKELEYDPEYARTYLRLLDFPLTEI